jgi:hypothetical protein
LTKLTINHFGEWQNNPNKIGDTMCEITMSYNNADYLFRHDEALRQAMNKWPGEETASSQDLETGLRHITYEFEDEGDDSLALKDLEEILGDRFEEIAYTGQPDKSPTTFLTINFEIDQFWMPREIISILASGLCLGWDVYTTNNDIVIECQSMEPAIQIMSQIESLDPNIKVIIMSEEEPHLTLI